MQEVEETINIISKMSNNNMKKIILIKRNITIKKNSLRKKPLMDMVNKEVEEEITEVVVEEEDS